MKTRILKHFEGATICSTRKLEKLTLMKIIVSQFYVEPGVYYPFHQRFQNRLSDRINELVGPSTDFTSEYGDDCSLIFRMSAKAKIAHPEIKGPTSFRRDKSVEYTIFLTFPQPGPNSRPELDAAVRELLTSICSILDKLGFDVRELQAQSATLSHQLAIDPMMVEGGE